jgi:hypothetical protein
MPPKSKPKRVKSSQMRAKSGQKRVKSKPLAVSSHSDIIAIAALASQVEHLRKKAVIHSRYRLG